MKPRSFLTLSALLLLLHAAPAQPQPQEALKLVTGLETAEGLKKTYATNLTSSALEANPDARYVSEGKASLKLSATASAAEGNQYLGAMIPVKLFDVAARSLLLDVWTSTPERTQALYVRLYDDAGKVIGSWNNWGLALKAHEKATVRLQRDISRGGFSYESKLITSASTTVHRIEVITGTRDKNVPFDLYVDNIRTSDRVYGSIVKLDKVKPLCLMTKLLEAAVVVPPELKESAAGLLANPPLAGNKPAIWPPTLPLDSSTHWLLIGNLNNNPAFLRFYSHSCGQADAVFPGEGGYLIHTVHDPFGTGKNVVLVGATDAAGAKRGCDELAAMLGAKPELGHAIKVAPSEDVRKRFGSLFREPSEPDIEKAAAGARSAMDGGGARGIVSTAAASGLNYSRTGLLGWAKRFKAMLFAYEDWVRDPKRIHGAHDGKWGMDVDFLTYELIPAWDIVEESGVFSDAERLRITRFLAEFVQEDTARQARSVLGNKRTRFNHQSFPALGCYYAGEYFKRNYSVAEADDWLEIADQCFQVQARYFKPYEDSNGYQWLVPWHTMQYAFARPDPTMFDLGAARKLADLSILTMDNLGYQSPFGDVGSCFGWNSDLILLAGARWHYRDGRYQWALDKRAAAGRTTGLGDFACTVAPQEPKDLLGVRSWPLEPSAYDLFKSKGKVGFDKTFDKVCFRSSFEPDKPYLLLDGVARAGHDHYDSNAFVRFTARNRLWLEDGDYIKSLPKFHNTLLVFRDGQSEKPSAFCELEHLADFTRVGFSETSLKDYAGVDWHRNVVWKKEGWFAVLDRVVARQDGDYSLRCQWRAMGAPTLAAPSFLVEQQGESLRIENADGSRLMLKEDAETGKNWGGYKLAEPVVRVLSQVTDRRLKSGEKHAFLNVLRVSPTDDAGDLKVRKLSDTCVEVTSDGQVALLGVGKSEMTDAALFFVDADGLALVGATQFAAGSFRLSADKPVDLEFDNKSGNGVAVASAATTLRVGDEAFAFPAAGKHEFQLKQGHAPFYALASLHPVAPDPKQPFVAPTTHLPTTPPPQNTSLLWRYRKEFDTYLLTNNRGRLEAYDVGCSVTVSPKPLDKNVFDPASPNSPEALTDGVTNTTEGSLMWAADQKVAVTVDLKNRYDLSRVVARLWWGSQSSKGNKFTYDHIRFSVSDDNFAKDVRVALDKAETDTYKDWGEPISYVAADVKQSGRYVRLEFTPKPGAGVYLAELEVWGKREGMPPSKATSAVNFLCLAACDVDGDGRDEVVAGATDNCVHLIGPDGKKRWTFETGGPVKSVWAGDLDADGKPEIVVGSRDAFIYLLDAQGKLKWKFELPRYHGRAGALVVVFAADLDGDGKKEVIGGSDNWHFYVFDAAGKFLWRYETVHRSTCGTAADLDGDGKLEVITGTEYYWWPVLSWDGKRKWGFSGGPTVNSVAAGDVDGDGKKEVVFGSADGCVYLVSHDGKKRWGFDTGDEVSAVAVADVDGDGKADVLAGSKNFNVYAFRGDGSVLWRRDLGDAVTALALLPSATSSERVIASPRDAMTGALQGRHIAVGCDNGLVVILSLQGEILARYPAAGPVLALGPGRLLPGPRAQILASCAGDGVIAIGSEK